LGYFGAIEPWLVDQELIKRAAHERPEWQWVFIGNCSRGLEIKALPNTHFLPPVAYDDLPSYAAGFDVCVLPWETEQAFTSYGSAIKVREYLATGKPVVISPLPEYEPMSNVLRIARSRDQFLSLVDEALQELGGRLINAQEEERSRIARELHDGLNQRIALLSIELSQLALDTQIPLNLNRTVRKLQAQVQEISTDVHRLSYKLHPSKLDHLGLAPAVKSLCKELSETLNIELKQTGFPATLPQDATLCAFRIVQEALRNCIRHSSARTVKVSVEKSDDAVRISVSDDGCGFDMESNAMKKGLGFISMRERLYLVGGAIQIQSQRLHGTQITVLIPLSPDKDLTYETKGPRALLDPTMRSKTIRSENWRKL